MPQSDRMGKENVMDEYTENALKNGISRRSFITRAALVAAGASVLGLAGCGSPSAEGSESDEDGAIYGMSSDGNAELKFLVKPEPITDAQIKETKTYDVVVVGAGASGVPAATSAVEAGAKVAVLQKEDTVISQGNTGSGIDLAKSHPAAVAAIQARLIKDCGHRSNPKLIKVWAENGGEAVKWVISKVTEAGGQAEDQGNKQAPYLAMVNGYPLQLVTSFMGPKPYTTGDGMRDMAKVAEKEGVEFFYSTPAVQLVKDKTGRVTGVIAKSADGSYVKFMAKKGVILAAGDYQNNKAMCDYFIPDAKNFTRKQINKTGDGHLMGFWAGAVLEDTTHSKMLHDFDAGPATMCDMPFLAVNQNGERFVNETAEMSILNNYLRQSENTGMYAQIFDSNYMTQVGAGWPGKAIPPEGLKNYMPEEDIEHKGVFESFIGTYKADTIEELAVKLDIDPAKLKETVDRYNELVAKGSDDDFGKSVTMLPPVLQAPFYGIHRKLRLSAVLGGLIVNEDSQCLDADGKPIDGLFAIGNQAGNFYGGVDYPMTLPGLSLGRCYTFGYVVGKHVASL